MQASHLLKCWSLWVETPSEIYGDFVFCGIYLLQKPWIILFLAEGYDM